MSVSPEALLRGATCRSSPAAELSVQVLLLLHVNGPNGNMVVEPAVSALFSPIATTVVGMFSKANHVVPPGLPDGRGEWDCEQNLPGREVGADAEESVVRTFVVKWVCGIAVAGLKKNTGSVAVELEQAFP